MKSSYIWRTFSSTTVLFVSFLSSSQASQNIMFSSLNSVRRNCLKQLRPAALFITLSNEIVQERASSRVGLGLQERSTDLSWHIDSVLFTAILSIMPHCMKDGVSVRVYSSHYLSSQLVVPSVLRSKVDLCIVSSSLLTVKLEEKQHNVSCLALIIRLFKVSCHPGLIFPPAYFSRTFKIALESFNVNFLF